MNKLLLSRVSPNTFLFSYFPSRQKCGIMFALAMSSAKIVLRHNACLQAIVPESILIGRSPRRKGRRLLRKHCGHPPLDDGRIPLQASEPPQKGVSAPPPNPLINTNLRTILFLNNFISRKDDDYETYQDLKHQKITEHNEKRRLRGMPDLLPVRMQDQLYRREPEL